MLKSYPDLKSRACRVLASPLRIDRDKGRENGSYRDYEGYMELYWSYIGVILG